jgi:hypothetical protein
MRRCSLRIQTILSNRIYIIPCGISDVPGLRSGSEPGNPGIGRVGRARTLRSPHRQFVGRAAGQLLRSGHLTWILHRRRHLRARIARRAFLRRLRRLTWLDRRILLRIDRHFALSGTFAPVRQRRAGGKVPRRTAWSIFKRKPAPDETGLYSIFRFARIIAVPPVASWFETRQRVRANARPMTGSAMRLEG